MKTKFFILLCIGYFCANAQIRFKEVDPNSNIVKIHNYGAVTIDISTYKLCVYPSYVTLNTLSVLSGSLNLDPNAEVTVISSINLNATGGELGLYVNTFNFADSNDMLDYLEWITSGHFREPVAVSANIWSTGTAISNSINPPYQYNGDGSTNNNGVTYWSSTLSANEFLKYDFKIYPIPADNILWLKFSNKTDINSISIFDLLGNQIFSSNKIEDSIDISNLSMGMYLLRVSSQNINHTTRFIKL